MSLPAENACRVLDLLACKYGTGQRKSLSISLQRSDQAACYQAMHLCWAHDLSLTSDAVGTVHLIVGNALTTVQLWCSCPH